MKSKILYLYSKHPLRTDGINSFSYRCETFVSELRKLYDLELKYAVSENSIPNVNNSEVIDPSKIDTYDMIILESLNLYRKETKKVSSPEILRNFLSLQGRRSVVYLVCPQESGNEIPSLSTIYNEFLTNAGLPMFRTPKTENEFPILVREVDNTQVIFGYDKEHALKGNPHNYIIEVNQTYLERIHPKLLSVYNEVKILSVNYTLEIDTSSVVLYPLLYGNRTTKRVTSGDYWWDGTPVHICGAIRTQHDMGNGVVITGGICDEYVVKSCQNDNIRFALNLVEFLLKR